MTKQVHSPGELFEAFMSGKKIRLISWGPGITRRRIADKDTDADMVLLAGVHRWPELYQIIPDPPTVGSPEWAVEQMKAGKVVATPCDELRRIQGDKVQIYEQLSGRWIPLWAVEEWPIHAQGMTFRLTEDPERPKSEICEHDSLKRKCGICERDEEIRELHDELDKLKSIIEQHAIEGDYADGRELPSVLASILRRLHARIKAERETFLDLQEDLGRARAALENEKDSYSRLEDNSIREQTFLIQAERERDSARAELAQVQKNCKAIAEQHNVLSEELARLKAHVGRRAEDKATVKHSLTVEPAPTQDDGQAKLRHTEQILFDEVKAHADAVGRHRLAEDQLRGVTAERDALLGEVTRLKNAIDEQAEKMLELTSWKRKDCGESKS